MRLDKMRLLITLVFVFLILTGCASTENKDQPTKATGWKIEGIVTSIDKTPIPNATIELKYHPFAYNNASTNAIAITKTDMQGKYVFERIESGVYFPQVTIPNAQGDCTIADSAIFIEVKDSNVTNMNLSYPCH